MSSKKKTPSTISSILSVRRGGLNQLIQTSQRLERLKQMLDQILPPQLGAHYEVCGLHNGTLILVTDSAAWATKLRFSAPNLVRKLRPQGVDLIDVRQRPRTENHIPRPAVRRAHMSADTAKQLKSLATTVSDNKLKLALERLALHGKQHNND